MEEGTLVYRHNHDRLDIQLANGDMLTFNGFPCGTTLEVCYNGEWVPTRIEHSGDWYLVGLFGPSQIPHDLRARKW